MSSSVGCVPRCVPHWRSAMSTCNLYVLLLLIYPAVESGKTLLAAGQDQNVAGAEAVVWIDVLDHLTVMLDGDDV